MALKRDLRITPELLVQWLRDGREHPALRIDHGLPEDAMLVGARFEPRTSPDAPEGAIGAGLVVLTFEAPSWESDHDLRVMLTEREPPREALTAIEEASRLLSRARYLFGRER